MATKKRSNNEGSIYQRRDGRWVGSISLSGGKRKDFYGRTRREVQQKLATALHHQQQGLPVANDQITVGRYLAHWLEYTAKPRVQESTFLGYRQLMEQHVTPTIGKRRLSRLSPEDLEQLYAEKVAAGLAPQTITNLHRVLHSALEQAVRRGQVARNVCDFVDPPRTSRYEIHPLDAEQARHFLEVVQGDPYEALYVVAITTGMRLGELLALKWADVDLEAATLQVRRGVRRIPKRGFIEKEPKSTKSRRRISLAAPAIIALQNHRAVQAKRRLQAGSLWEDHDLVFPNLIGRHIEAGNLKRRSYWPLLQRAGLPRIRFHDLRHSAATLLLALGVHPKIVQELLGHSQIGLTLDTYSHVIPTLQCDAMSRLASLLSPDG